MSEMGYDSWTYPKKISIKLLILYVLCREGDVNLITILFLNIICNL